MTDSLFPDLTPAEGSAPTEALSYGRRLTLRQRADVARGRHPLTGGPLSAEPGVTCGNCRYRGHNGRGYPKCHLGPFTRGAATDVRAWWPACTRWEPDNRDRTVGPDAARWTP